MTIEWLPGAILDLERVKEFLRPLNTEASKKVVYAIKAAVRLLTPHHYGKPVENLFDHYDVIIPFGSAGYVLRYSLEDGNIFIVAIKHTKEVRFSSKIATITPSKLSTPIGLCPL